MRPTPVTYLFLDTEWADVAALQLVSLALVSDDGQFIFYAERDPLPERATEFVRDSVYPLLERGGAAMSDAAMTRALRSFLAGIPTPYLIADYEADLRLAKHVLAGFELSDMQAAACGPIPQPVLSKVIEDWFATHPDEASRRHHALVDSPALRMACLAISGRVKAPWSKTLAS